jgi:alkylation response protein AidB-like acyl-CoA dehydrogenase
VRSETGWTVDGQKVWTSGAQRADRGMLLARTNRDVPFRDLTIGTQRPAR